MIWNKQPKSCLDPKRWGYQALGISIKQWHKLDIPGERSILDNPDKRFIMKQLELIEEIDRDSRFWYEFDKSGGLQVNG